MIKDIQQKYNVRHSRESGNPGVILNEVKDIAVAFAVIKTKARFFGRRGDLRMTNWWIPAFAGMALFFFPPNALAQKGRYVNEFLNAGLGVRAQSMSQSFVAVADDVSAMLWNPAGLTQLPRYQLETTFRTRLEDFVRDQSVGLSIPALSKMKSVFGVGYFQSQIRDVAVTPSLTPQEANLYQLGLFNPQSRSEQVQDSAFLLSWGFQLNKRISLGLTGKMINRDFLGNIRGTGYGADLGLLTRIGPFALGFGVRDVVGQLKWKGNLPSDDRSINFTENPGRVFHMGTAYFMPLLGGHNKLVLALGGQSGPTGFVPSLGAELRFQAYQVRLGVVQNNTEDDIDSSSGFGSRILPSLGLGLSLKPFNLQYAITQHPLGFDQGFSLAFLWGAIR